MLNEKYSRGVQVQVVSWRGPKRLANSSIVPMLSIKAGRAFRRGTTSWVDPQATKGLLGLAPGDDGLLHFTWKNRDTENIEDDLIIIPGDASFHRVAESTSGRIFVLKFESSDQKHFFWIQDPSASILDQIEPNVNGLLQDPEFQPSWTTPTAPTAPRTAPATIPTQNEGAGSTSNEALTQSLVDQLRAMMEQRMGSGSRLSGQQLQPPSLALSDMLSPSNLAPLFEPSNSTLLSALQDYLPPDIPSDPDSTTEDTLRRVIQSGPFQSTVRQLDRAFNTGLLSRLMPGFGLPEEAGLSVEAFLKAIHDKAKREEHASQPQE